MTTVESPIIYNETQHKQDATFLNTTVLSEIEKLQNCLLLSSRNDPSNSFSEINDQVRNISHLYETQINAIHASIENSNDYLKGVSNSCESTSNAVINLTEKCKTMETQITELFEYCKKAGKSLEEIKEKLSQYDIECDDADADADADFDTDDV